MTTVQVSETLKTLAKDLRKDVPRSPRETLGGYIIAARTLDKCRAFLNGTNGEYHFDCPLDNVFLSFVEISAEDFKNFVATGASDEAVAEWIQQHAKPRERLDVIKWNNYYRGLMLKDAPDQVQLFMEDYIAQYLPKGRPVYVWFDVYDIEEGRLS